MTEGKEHVLRPFGATRRLAFSHSTRVRCAAFNFPEQRTLSRTLEVASVRSWLRLQPGPAHAAVSLAVRTGATRLLAAPPLRAGLLATLSRLPQHAAGCAVSAEVVGERKGTSTCVSAWLSCRGEAAVTAHVAGLVARRLLGGGQPPGVWHIEQLPNSEGLLAATVMRRQLGE